MFARISLFLLLLVILCPVGCYCYLKSSANDLKQVNTDVQYYAFNIPRAADHPEQTDRNILKQMWRDTKATKRDIDYYLLDAECDNYDRLPDP
jgi:hypothetical protein